MKKELHQLGFLLLALLCLSGIPGCASKQLATKESDLQAKQFSPPADRSYIYVLRQPSIKGGGVDLTINLDGTRAGAIQNKTYALFDVDPGVHVLRMGTLLPNPTPTEQFFVPTQIELDTQPGRVYFVSGRGRMDGSFIGYDITVLPVEEGKRMLLEDNYERVMTVY